MTFDSYDTMIWVSIVANSNGTTDCELLSTEPTEEFRNGLWDSIAKGTVEYFEIRSGYLNGGDSRIEYASNG